METINENGVDHHMITSMELLKLHEHMKEMGEQETVADIERAMIERRPLMITSEVEDDECICWAPEESLFKPKETH